MTTRVQIALSVVIIAAAAVAVVSLQEEATDQQEAAGHDHAAMGAGGDVMNPVRLDAEASRRIGVTFAEVVRRTLQFEVKAVGIVTYDETRLTTVSPKIDGWVERLHVDFTGAPVREGQALLDIYSPALVTAQEELALAASWVQEAGAGRAADNARELLASARRRLAYWDVPEAEIRRIEESGEVRKTVTLEAPASGVVIEKAVVEGDRIMPGMAVYRIADLSRVWIEADVFEKDLGLVEVGQTAEVTLEAYPGRSLDARVTYIFPTVSLDSRTARVRLELPNPALDLKPGMYAQIHLQVPAARPTLTVPRSAVLATGERALVFVRVADGSLMPREVTTGRTVGTLMEVLGGLDAGDEVVSSAAFLVDAESNLGALTAGLEATDTVPAEDQGGHDGEDGE